MLDNNIIFSACTVYEWGAYAELSHHSCGFLFGVLQDDGNLLFDITDKSFSNARLGVQNCATNVDAVKRSYSCYTGEYLLYN